MLGLSDNHHPEPSHFHKLRCKPRGSWITDITITQEIPRSSVPGIQNKDQTNSLLYNSSRARSRLSFADFRSSAFACAPHQTHSTWLPFSSLAVCVGESEKSWYILISWRSEKRSQMFQNHILSFCLPTWNQTKPKIQFYISKVEECWQLHWSSSASAESLFSRQHRRCQYWS